MFGFKTKVQKLEEQRRLELERWKEENREEIAARERDIERALEEEHQRNLQFIEYLKQRKPTEEEIEAQKKRDEAFAECNRIQTRYWIKIGVLLFVCCFFMMYLVYSWWVALLVGAFVSIVGSACLVSGVKRDATPKEFEEVMKVTWDSVGATVMILGFVYLLSKRLL